MSLLEVKNLKTYFYIDKDEYPAVDGISFSIDQGKTLALIGESGSGKSVTSLSIMGLIDFPGKVVEGEVIYNNKDLLKKKEKEMQRIRGNEIAMIYQDPMTTLNPLIKVGKQIAEPLLIHKKANREEAYKRAVDLMKAVGITDAEERFHHLPDQFSGGMRQRLMIAMAIACDPKLLIADEPTTALDVTIQAEILDLLKDLKDKYNMSLILSTHDLGVVAEMADDIVVLYGGKVMERARSRDLFNKPLNPYTIELMECIPRIDDKKERLDTIKGYVPHLTEMPKGCKFSDRCSKAFDTCKEELPDLLEIEEDHWSRCWLHQE